MRENRRRDAVTDLGTGYILSNGDNLSGAIRRQDHIRLDRKRIVAAQNRELAKIKRHCAHVHENLMRARCRSVVCSQHDAVDAGAEIGVIAFHGRPPTTR